MSSVSTHSQKSLGRFLGGWNSPEESPDHETPEPMDVLLQLEGAVCNWKELGAQEDGATSRRPIPDPQEVSQAAPPWDEPKARSRRRLMRSWMPSPSPNPEAARNNSSEAMEIHSSLPTPKPSMPGSKPTGKERAIPVHSPVPSTQPYSKV